MPESAAAAPAMPATAPPLASAPATIVAPSSFDIFIGQPPGGVVGAEDLHVRAIVHPAAKRARRRG